MNDDFILRARLHQQDVEKGFFRRLGARFGPMQMNRQQAQLYDKQVRAGKAAKARQNKDLKNLAAGTPTTASGFSTTSTGKKDITMQGKLDDAELANVEAEGQARMEAMGPEPAAAAPPATGATPPATGATAPATGTETPATGTETPATGATAPATDAGATAPAAGGTAAAPAAAAPAATPGLNPQVQGMAQQFQAGQDMQTLQQGKGADPQTYMKNRSLMGKIMDVGTLGLTSQFGATGGIARRKANQQSEQQTQRYNQAQGRMNQRAMGMSPVMTSFDSPSSAYRDLGEMIAIRKSIQERNTTDNLRRW